MRRVKCRIAEPRRCINTYAWRKMLEQFSAVVIVVAAAFG